jgi:SAM-dependent methyltransferase
MLPDPLVDFPWPAPPGASTAPVWSPAGFRLNGDPARAVLVYDAADSHWSPELTDLHEAEAGSQHPIDLASRRWAVRSLAEYLPPDRPQPVVLDVGCSSGFVLEEIQAALPQAALIGSDYILPPLEKLAQRLPGVPLLQFDLRRCPLPDGCVDAVTALNVLEHIDDDTAALREIGRILRPGGVAHIEVPAGPGCYDVYDEQLMHHRRYRLAALLAQARGAGFDVLRATHLGCLIYPAFWLVKRRGRRLLRLPAAEKKALVARQIRHTGQSVLLGAVLRLEEAIGRYATFPFGIRCIAVLRKKSAVA